MKMLKLWQSSYLLPIVTWRPLPSSTVKSQTLNWFFSLWGREVGLRCVFEHVWLTFSCSAAWRAEGQTRSAVNHTYEKTLLISWIRCSWTYWHLCWCCCSVFQFIASLGRCFAGLPFFSFLFYYLSLKWLKSSYRLCQDWEKQCSPTLVAWGPKVPRPCGRSCSHDSHDTGFYSDNTVISKVYLCFWVCMFPGLVAQEHLARGLLWPGRWFRDEQWVGA